MDVRTVIDDLGLRNCRESGDNIVCSCPFPENHPNGDAHPSFSINRDSGLWICFGCGEKGNLPQLYERVMGLSPAQAASKALLLVGTENLTGSRGTPVSGAYRADRIDLSFADHQTDYWASRGFTDETVMRWRLGYDPKHNRAVVPITVDGIAVAWTSRRIAEDGTPKWTHSDGFSKKGVLFGLDRAEGEVAILVEAPLSAIMLAQQGWPYAVASFGCNLSQGQADLLVNRFERCVIMYDPDEAGVRGTKEAIAKLSGRMMTMVAGPAVDDPAAQTREQNERTISTLTWSWAVR